MLVYPIKLGAGVITMVGTKLMGRVLPSPPCGDDVGATVGDQLGKSLMSWSWLGPGLLLAGKGAGSSWHLWVGLSLGAAVGAGVGRAPKDVLNPSDIDQCDSNPSISSPFIKSMRLQAYQKKRKLLHAVWRNKYAQLT